MKKRNKLKISFGLTLLSGVTFSYIIWLFWKKLTDFVGDTWIVMGIAVAILIVLAFAGYFSFDKLARKFT